MDIISKMTQSSKSPCLSLILEKYKHIDNLNSQHFDSGYEQVIATKIPCSTMHFGENCALPRCSGFKNIFVRARQKQISRHFFDPCMLLYCDFCLKFLEGFFSISMLVVMIHHALSSRRPFITKASSCWTPPPPQRQ